MSDQNNFIEDIVSRRRPYVIAEAGINHNGDMSMAREMIDAAKDSGADCIKFQSFICDKYISTKAGRAKYQDQEAVGEKSQKQIIQECEFEFAQFEELKAHCESRQIDFMSTPFEVWSLRMLINLGVPAMKISSCNLTNIPLLTELAKTKVPVLLSTGMGTLEEVEQAVKIFKDSQSPLMLFQCTSNYPSKIENANLRVLQDYQERFDVPVGLSDHTPTHTTCIAAIALGAIAVEKHFTLSRTLPGIDQKASLEPQELKELVTAVNDCYKALGSAKKSRTEEEFDTFNALRRSLVAARDIQIGETLREDMVAIKRPGNGLPTNVLADILNKELTREIKADELFTMEDFKG